MAKMHTYALAAGTEFDTWANCYRLPLIHTTTPET